MKPQGWSLTRIAGRRWAVTQHVAHIEPARAIDMVGDELAYLAWLEVLLHVDANMEAWS